MRLAKYWYFLLFAGLSCSHPAKPPGVVVPKDSVDRSGYYVDSKKPITTVATGKTTPAELIAFARSLTGIPYKYGSTDPAKGFDCSGFITYVFNHFGIIVPRQSVDFTSMKREIDIKQAKPGDLILFTGTDSTTRIVGHMGIIVSPPGGEIKFIHSTSGRAYGVIETVKALLRGPVYENYPDFPAER
jgi:murein DD-endopeptidase / murein LD-carboxypeptidase